MDPRAIRLGKASLRVALSAAALYVVWQQIDAQQFFAILRSADILWLIVAIVLYVLSKVLSSLRLTRYFLGNEINITERDNLKLYFLGMFYNLFLPGGIGGDGYKIWYVCKERGATFARAFQSVFFDRVNGMFLLAALGLFTGWIAFPEIPMRSTLLAGGLLAVPFLYLAHRLSARQFLPAFTSTTLLSLGVQAVQMLCAYALLFSLGLREATGPYLTVFLLSSLVAVLPISIGGIGLRELVFVTAAGLAPINRDASVAFSMMFFAVTAIVSLPGGLITLEVNHARDAE